MPPATNWLQVSMARAARIKPLQNISSVFMLLLYNEMQPD